MVRAARVERVVLVEPQAILAIPEMPEVVAVVVVDRAPTQATHLEAQPQVGTALFQRPTETH